ncbi:MAG: hypothetical protein ACI4R8_01160 [Candidatus Caccovivens sp.]
MKCGPQNVAIVDVKSVLNLENGDRTKKVVNGKLLVLKVDLVGIQTLQLGQTQGFNLTYSIEIPRYLYNNEKYCFMDNQLYEIRSMSKAKSEANMLLNVSMLEDSTVSEAILSWIKEKTQK